MFLSLNPASFLLRSDAFDTSGHCLLETHTNLVSMTLYTPSFSLSNSVFFISLPDSSPASNSIKANAPHVSTWSPDLCSPLPSTERNHLFLFHHHLYVDSSEACISNPKWHSHMSNSPLASSICRSYYHFKFSILGAKLITYPAPLPNEVLSIVLSALKGPCFPKLYAIRNLE